MTNPRYQDKLYYVSKCPAKNIVTRALVSAQYTIEVKGISSAAKQKCTKVVKSCLSKSKLIEFKKLNDIYTRIRNSDKSLNEQTFNEYKVEILAILKPQYLLYLHLYIKYHKIYHEELFNAFCEMLGLNKAVKLEDITRYYMETIGYAEELLAEIKKSIYDLTLSTDSKKHSKGEPNYRTMRRNSSKFTIMFHLETPPGSDEKFANKVITCPHFVCDELWECMENYKLKRDDTKIIDSSRIKNMGRLYMIILLTYAFDENNYTQGWNTTFRTILNRSLESPDVCDLLKAYLAITDNEKDKSIITEILGSKS